MADATPAPIDPQLAAGVGLLRQVLLGAGVLLAGHGFIGPGGKVSADNWQFFVGLVVMAAPIVWGAWSKFSAAKTAAARETVAVQAGINLVTAGAALTTDYKRIPASADVPLPVTANSAQSIIAKFAPSSPPGTTADDLNSAEAARVRMPQS